MELKDIAMITYELMRVKEDRLRMCYEDEISSYRRSNENLLRKYKRSTTLLASLQHDYDVLKNKVYMKKRPIEQSLSSSHITARNESNVGCSNHGKQAKDDTIDSNSRCSGDDVIKKAKTIDNINLANKSVNPILHIDPTIFIDRPMNSIAIAKPYLDGRRLAPTVNDSKATPIILIDSQSSTTSSYEENQEHHHLVVKLLEKDEKNHIKSTLNSNHSMTLNIQRTDEMNTKYSGLSKPPIKDHQRSANMSSSHLDISRYGNNRLNDLIGPNKTTIRATEIVETEGREDDLQLHSREVVRDRDIIERRKRDDTATTGWNDKDDIFDCDQLSNAPPVRNIDRNDNNRREGQRKDDGNDDRRRNERRDKDQFQRLLDLRNMRTASSKITKRSYSSMGHHNDNKLINKTETLLSSSIDHKSHQPSHAMKCIETVRGKENRAALPGHTCMECLKFYETMQQQGVYADFSDSQVRRKVLQSCSRHKAKWSPPSTPEGFWDLSLGTPEDWK